MGFPLSVLIAALHGAARVSPITYVSVGGMICYRGRNCGGATSVFIVARRMFDLLSLKNTLCMLQQEDMAW